ncbi:Uncharacterised protein [Neisseria subflava]|uniref:Periplasmic protein n=1 Tax=Neisseria subflava TaxID=28449 RepID=A0A9X9QZY5_NEISU|nr:hypothetical protein [Neisseria subflava]VTY08855.1 Uncharacterised protein [Neisseria subflava]
MKPFFCKTAIAFSLTLPAAANAAEYVCNVEGITVYTSHQINNTCRVTDSYSPVETNVFQTNAEQLNLNSTLTEQQTDPKLVGTQNIFDRTGVTNQKTTRSTADYYVPVIETQTAIAPVETKQYPVNTFAIFNTTPVVQVYPSAPIAQAQTTPQESHRSDSFFSPHTEQTSTQTLAAPNAYTDQATTTQFLNHSLDLEPLDNKTAKSTTAEEPAKTEVTYTEKTVSKTSTNRKTNIKKTVTKPLTAENSSVSSDKTNILTGSTTEIFALTDSVKPTEPIPATAIPTKPTKTPLPKAYGPTTDALFSDKDVDNDIKILLNGPIGGVTNTAEAANPRLNILLRNSIQKRQAKQNSQQDIRRKAPIRTIPATIAVPQPKPKETRKQVLQGEIRNEQTAIIRLQTQLNAAKQKGDQIKIQQLTRTINDRKANIRAIQGEMSR